MKMKAVFATMLALVLVATAGLAMGGEPEPEAVFKLVKHGDSCDGQGGDETIDVMVQSLVPGAGIACAGLDLIAADADFEWITWGDQYTVFLSGDVDAPDPSHRGQDMIANLGGCTFEMGVGVGVWSLVATVGVSAEGRVRALQPSNLSFRTSIVGHGFADPIDYNGPAACPVE